MESNNQSRYLLKVFTQRIVVFEIDPLFVLRGKRRNGRERFSKGFIEDVSAFINLKRSFCSFYTFADFFYDHSQTFADHFHRKRDCLIDFSLYVNKLQQIFSAVHR